jgi:hypothetical protein
VYYARGRFYDRRFDSRDRVRAVVVYERDGRFYRDWDDRHDRDGRYDRDSGYRYDR